MFSIDIYAVLFTIFLIVTIFKPMSPIYQFTKARTRAKASLMTF